MWKILHKLFGFDYVVLQLSGDNNLLRRAYTLGDQVWAHPYMPETRAKLLPNGETDCVCYVKSWTPVTPKMKELYNVNNSHE